MVYQFIFDQKYIATPNVSSGSNNHIYNNIIMMYVCIISLSILDMYIAFTKNEHKIIIIDWTKLGNI